MTSTQLGNACAGKYDLSTLLTTAARSSHLRLEYLWITIGQPFFVTSHRRRLSAANRGWNYSGKPSDSRQFSPEFPGAVLHLSGSPTVGQIPNYPYARCNDGQPFSQSRESRKLRKIIMFQHQYVTSFRTFHLFNYFSLLFFSFQTTLVVLCSNINILLTILYTKTSTRICYKDILLFIHNYFASNLDQLVWAKLIETPHPKVLTLWI